MSLSFRPEEIGSAQFHSFVGMLLRGNRKVALTFSGGRDSIAMYHAMTPYLDRITVVWVNSGNLFPEVLEYIDGVRKKTPHFVEITSNQPEQVRENGYPVDVLPIDYTVFGASCTEPRDIKLQAYLDCCAINISIPLYNYVKDNKFTLVLRGNRLSEGHKSPGKNGDSQEGIRFLSLIEDWTDEEVLNYLKNNGEEITPRLTIGHSSLDCMDCTAYTCHSFERMQYIKQHHPITFHRLRPIFMKIDRAVRRESEGLERILSL
jgi:phosphoadenosine phosphosulfate reductase